MTAPYLVKEMGIVDEVIKEPFGGAHRDPAAMAASPSRRCSLRPPRGASGPLKEKELLGCCATKKFRDFGEFKETGTE